VANNLATLRADLETALGEFDGAMVNAGLRAARCRYQHHATCGQALKCAKCGGVDVACGPYGHACRVCDGSALRKCLICGQPGIFCSC
jgi:hypothetical protein